MGRYHRARREKRVFLFIDSAEVTPETAGRVAGGSGSAQQTPEGETDPLAADTGLARHAVDEVPLTRPAHHEQAPMLDVERPARSWSDAPRLQHELACRAERQRGDDGIAPELGLVIGVETDAVGPVAVAVGEDVIERHLRVIDHACEQ